MRRTHMDRTDQTVVHPKDSKSDSMSERHYKNNDAHSKSFTHKKKHKIIQKHHSKDQ